MTPLATLRELLGRATPGEWVVVESLSAWLTKQFAVSSSPRLERQLDPVSRGAVEEHDARLIAASHNALAKLLDVAEAAGERVKAGHNDTCGKSLCEYEDYGYPCSCGHDELRAALRGLEG